jgi:thymidylate synthase (FAD)
VSEIKVLDHGFVRLDGALADDLSVVNSARVSFARRQDAMDEPSEKLLAYLMKNRHGTPFEHNMFRFHVKAPIMVFREWQRHRISSYNEWSARYSQLEPEFYIPKPEHVRSQVGKPGAYTFERVEAETANNFRASLKLSSEIAYGEYEDAIAKGIAKEQARLFLPVNIYSQMYWTVNARSLMNFLSLRNSEHAMFEIAEYAVVIESIFRDLMPVTAEAFVLNGRNAP